MQQVTIDTVEVNENPTLLTQLTKAHHVGLIMPGVSEKFYFAYCGGEEKPFQKVPEKVRVLSIEQGDGISNKIYGSDEFHSPSEFIDKFKPEFVKDIQVFVFPTRKDLYRWLSE